MTDKKSDRLGTMVFTIANELVNHFGKKLDRPVIDDITRNLTLEMCGGPTAWAFSGKDEPGKPIFDEAKERELFERIMTGRGWSVDKVDGFYSEPYAHFAWSIILECAHSRAKAGEVGHE